MTLEIYLQSLELEAPFDTKGSLNVVVELVWPRAAIHSRSAVKSVAMQKGKGKLPLKPVYSRLMLKENVDGNFGLTVGITKLQSNPKLAQFINEVLVTAVEATGGALSSALELPATALKKVVEAPFDRLADELDEESLELVAKTGFDFNSESSLEGSHVFELKLNRTIRIAPEVKAGPPKGRQKRTTKGETYRKGTKVGTATLRLKPI